jgi:hypothetical protein
MPPANNAQRAEPAVARARGSSSLVVDMESGVRGYLLTGAGRFLDPYRKGPDARAPPHGKRSGGCGDGQLRGRGQRPHAKAVLAAGTGRESALHARRAVGAGLISAAPSRFARDLPPPTGLGMRGTPQMKRAIRGDGARAQGRWRSSARCRRRIEHSANNAPRPLNESAPDAVSPTVPAAREAAPSCPPRE